MGGDAVIEVLGWDTDSVLLPCMILLSLWAVASVGAYFCMRRRVRIHGRAVKEFQ